MPAARRIPEHEWQKYKAEIQKSYVKDDRTLEETMKLMEERHSFHARLAPTMVIGDRLMSNSKSQFCRQLKKWEFVKNTTDKQWAIIGYKVKERRARGRESEIVMGGSIVPKQKARKEISRHPRSTWDEYSQTSDSL